VALLVNGAAVNASQNHGLAAVVTQKNIGFHASEGDSDVADHTVDQFIQVKNRRDLLGCPLQLEQIVNLVGPNWV
jgi:hypothetical protein